VCGWGGSAALFQCLPCDFTFGLRGEFRRPYNYIEALLGWSTHTGWGDVNIGIYGGHTYGKDRVPSTSVAGVSIYWDFGGSCCKADCCAPCCPCNDLARWISVAPAVYVPVVLAIAEQKTNVNIIPPVCTDPLVIGSTGPFTIPFSQLPFQVPTAQLFDFQGQTPTFSLQTDAPEQIDATIDPVSGIVTINVLPADVFHVFTVTATVPGGCSASTSFQAISTEG
jgi:hypothetical protein